MFNYTYTALYLFTNIVHLFLSIVMFLMVVRAVLSWLPIADDSLIERYVYAITEPFVVPVRAFIEKFESLANFPIDISFLITFVILSICIDILSVFRV